MVDGGKGGTAVLKGTTASDAESRAGTPAAPVFGRRNSWIAGGLFLLALCSIFALQRLFHIAILGISDTPHYIYQASSFLQGRWDLDLPPLPSDIIVVNGKHFIVYPPFPAVLLIPVFLVFRWHTSDIFFTAVMSAVNLPLMYLLFEQVRANGLTRRPWFHNLIMAVLFYFGSLSLWLSLGGRMWFTAQIVCFTFTLLSLLMAFRRHFGWSAVFLACAFFSRATVIFGFPFLFYLAWQNAEESDRFQRFVVSLARRKPDWQAVPWRRLVAPAAVSVAMIALFMVRNYESFGSPFETGYVPLLAQHYPMVTNGPFSLTYVPANIVANFFTFPRIMFSGPVGGAFDRHPVFDMLNNGLAISVFFTTPLFLLLFWRNRTRSPMRIALWATLGLVVVAVLLFHASGWYQFGARYLFDGYAYAFLLLVLNEVRVDWRFVALGLIAIFINVLGAAQFWTHHLFQL